MAVFRRADFEERIEQVRRKTFPLSLVSVLGWGFGLSILLALHAFRMIPTSSLFPLMMLLIAVTVGSIIATAVRSPRMSRESGLVCPKCNAALTLARRGGLVDAVLKTGKCPRCGTPLLDPGEAGERREGPLTLRDHLEAWGTIGAMLLAIAGLLLFGPKSMTRFRSDICVRRYAAAHTAADSARVDQSGFGKSKNPATTCAAIRSAGEGRAER